MKKIIIALCVIILMIAIIIQISRDSDIPIWKENALKLSTAIEDISGYQPIVTDLTDFTPFDWDELYSFQPYFEKKEIYKIIGYKWTDINESVSEGMNQVVFLNDGEVVCYIYGYPDLYNLYLDFGYHKEEYFHLDFKDKTKFIITVKDDIKYFEFIVE